jgi:hypothetical protein
MRFTSQLSWTAIHFQSHPRPQLTCLNQLSLSILVSHSKTASRNWTTIRPSHPQASCRSHHTHRLTSSNHSRYTDISSHHLEQHQYHCRVTSSHSSLISEGFSYHQGSYSITSRSSTKIHLCIAEQCPCQHLVGCLRVCKALHLRVPPRIFPFNPQ